jgi:hypothetical protein
MFTDEQLRASQQLRILWPQLIDLNFQWVAVVEEGLFAYGPEIETVVEAVSSYDLIDKCIFAYVSFTILSPGTLQNEP